MQMDLLSIMRITTASRRPQQIFLSKVGLSWSVNGLKILEMLSMLDLGNTCLY